MAPPQCAAHVVAAVVLKTPRDAGDGLPRHKQQGDEEVEAQTEAEVKQGSAHVGAPGNFLD